MRHRRQTFRGAQRAMAEATISKTLIQLFKGRLNECSLQRTSVALFRAFDGEPSLEDFERWAFHESKVELFYAQIPSGEEQPPRQPLTFVTPKEWTRWRGRCPQPVGEPVSWERLTHILVPGLLFDKGGYRIGLGGGYYDRTLSQQPAPISIGVAFSFQCVDALPRAPWERPLDAIVSEEGLAWIGID